MGRLRALVLLSVLLMDAAQAAPLGVVISEFRTRGPGGASDEFVELHNVGASSVDISGWKLNGCQSGTPGTESTRVTIASGVSLPAGGRYLLANSASAYSAGVPGDQTYGTGISDFTSTAYAGLALRDAANGLQDGVGAPLSPCREGSAGIVTSATTPTDQLSRHRLAGESQDSGDNAADFGPDAAATPTALGSTPPPACTNVGIGIPAIQGRGHVSGYNGLCVSQVPGVVTQRSSNGFYLQDPVGDGDEATSDGIFVFTSSAPAASITVGSQVLVDGTVSEFRAGSTFTATNCASSSAACNLTITEITGPTVTATSGLFGGAAVTPVILGAAGRMPPTEVIDDDTSGSVEVAAQTTYDPAEDGIDFYESLEGMQVRIDNARASGPTSSFGEVWVLADGGADASGTNARGGITLVERAAGVDYNPERIQIDLSGLTSVYPLVNVGDTAASVTGAMSYGFGDPRVFPTELPSFVSGGIARVPASLSSGTDRLRIASYNVENLDPNDADTCDGGPDQDIANGRFTTEAQQIVDMLGAPDIVALEEIQDNSGCANDGTVDADVTLQTLVDAITAAGGPSYRYTTISPQDGTDGGVPGGNIRQGFLYDATRVTLVPGTAGAGDATTATAASIGGDGKLQLSLSPGRVDPTNTAWDNSRKPLAATFDFNGERVLAIVNHFNSKGGDYPLFGRYQPPVLSSETQRLQQAQVLHDFIAGVLAQQPAARVITLGDFNDFEWSAPMQKLSGADIGTPILTDLATLLLPETERYSYVFEGNSQELDHIFVSEATLTAAEFQAVHINAEFADQASDHDPIASSLQVKPVAVCDGGSIGFVSAAPIVVDEGERTLVGVTRSGAGCGAASANWSRVLGSASADDLIGAASGVLSWADGDISTRYILVAARRDARREGAETLNLQLSVLSGAQAGITTRPILIDDPR
ncbi:MAG: choice-of-anchor protein [Hydrocarboniphaga sp.]|uniref:lamin tail domain-containing protein n=1 Tax=Hydrocarboniphaga sp. TaxID=2033016 RepID=UPI002607CA68|nr:lamin tail domain-containing protein [Hydrocarboniphaga sp.]MDB5971595.1 choice-of-anchor protein [Hydrocarboniphaga sp.]